MEQPETCNRRLSFYQNSNSDHEAHQDWLPAIHVLLAHGLLLLNKSKATGNDLTWFFTKNISDTFSKKKPTCLPQLLRCFLLPGKQHPCFKATMTMDPKEQNLGTLCALALFYRLRTGFQEVHKGALRAEVGLGHENRSWHGTQCFCECPSCRHRSIRWQKPCCFHPIAGPAQCTSLGWQA